MTSTSEPAPVPSPREAPVPVEPQPDAGPTLLQRARALWCQLISGLG